MFPAEELGEPLGLFLDKRALELDRLGVNAVGRRAEADRLKITLAISTLEQQLQNGSCMWVAM